MKKLICVMLLFGILVPGFAQKEKEQSALEAMVATELAFAKMAKDVGTRPAFSAFIADDGILFRPGPVKGKEWLAKNPAPAPASGRHPWLSWYPTVADISLAGDMGYTTGPWEFRPDVNDAKAVAFGNFLTVWKKQADGAWRFVIDLGISGPQPSETIAAWQPPKSSKRESKAAHASVEAEQALLLAKDSEFSKLSATRDAQTAFESFASSDVRVFRDEKIPIVGKAAGLTALPATSSIWTWKPTFADVSRSGDLGYTYGTYRIASKGTPAKNLESGNYYRIWKKQGGKWVVVADLTNPVPEEKKN
ncbi:MAG TPA: nuclear transport factor 2 family protein [Pyrinomonadaceae bacterium]|nr:nuclear transport factor 2 family protein [Pyrinomonadaceae bacterium]